MSTWVYVVLSSGFAINNRKADRVATRAFSACVSYPPTFNTVALAGQQVKSIWDKRLRPFVIMPRPAYML